jgi:hypothetical protein
MTWGLTCCGDGCASQFASTIDAVLLRSDIIRSSITLILITVCKQKIAVIFFYLIKYLFIGVGTNFVVRIFGGTGPILADFHSHL